MVSLGVSQAGIPTSARYRVLLLAFLITGITYLDRVCMAAAAPVIIRDLRLSNMQMGYVFGVFALAYGLFEIPAGWLGDRIGQRKMLMRIVVCWSSFTALTGVAWNFSVLILTRFMFGAAEAGAFPTLSRSLARWFPPLDRGRVNGILWMGARLGGALAPPLANLLIAWCGWRLGFVVFGAVGFVWSAVFWLWYRDDPACHPGVNRAELAYIQQCGPSRVAEHPQKRSTPWKRIFLSGNLWAMFWMYFATSYGFWFFLTWLPTFLIRDHGLTAERAGFYSALPLGMGAAACVTGGTLSDWLARRSGSLRFGRRAVGLDGFLLAGLGFGAAALAHGPIASVFLLSLGAGAMDLAVPVAWAACLEIGGGFGGTTAGFMNSGSSISALLSPIAAAWFFERFGSFKAMFVSAMVVYILAGLLWLKIDPTRPLSAE
jgi:MFS family permease